MLGQSVGEGHTRTMRILHSCRQLNTFPVHYVCSVNKTDRSSEQDTDSVVNLYARVSLTGDTERSDHGHDDAGDVLLE
jgi:hypothetical protein